MRLAAMSCLLTVLLLSNSIATAGDGNRLAYLDGPCDPYYAGRHLAKLVTPQWVGEPGVEAVIVLSIDDLSESARYETFLRPIFERLKKIDGRAPVSLMANRIDPEDPRLQKWLKEGASLEAHTYAHPCPLLQGGDLAAAKATYDRNVDLMTSVPNSRPVAYRMPCCDSMSSVSPRFFTEIFNKTTPGGNFVALDSSVFLLFTADDPDLPRELVLDEDGREKFRKYVPTDRIMANLIYDYPYPYVIDRLCWEIPVLMPSDWDAQHLHGVCSPTTVADLKAAVDATVIKRGIFALCFHPHGWIRNDQIVELIDHAVARHGKKVKFLTFREVYDRLTKNLLGGNPLRATNGQDNGVRVLDLDNDGYMDVVLGSDHARKSRVWSSDTRRWQTSPFPWPLVATDPDGHRNDMQVRFAVLRPDGNASALRGLHLSHYAGLQWSAVSRLQWSASSSQARMGPVIISSPDRDRSIRLHDLDGDGISELILGHPNQLAVFRWRSGREGPVWSRLPFSLPEGTSIVDGQGRDAGLRFVDIDEDGRLDVVFSNAERYSIDLFTSMKEGWSRRVVSGKRGEKDSKNELPMIVRADGTNNGAWFADRHMWVQNEDTGNSLPGHVDSRWFTNLLAAENDPPLRTPRQSLAAMKPRAGFKVELMAAEPLVMDPIDIAWGPDGKAWVVEMADYPMGISPDGHLGPPKELGIPGGRVRCLEDTDGDGKYDKSTVFLEPVGFPSSVMPWRGGVIVVAAPEIFYAEDTDGDGRADLRRTLFSGFSEGNQQHRVNHLRWGLDNWVYLANGDSNGSIKSAKTGKVVDIGGRDLCIKPDSGEIDTREGRTQFGRNRDDWGNWFGCNNPNPGWHYALADHYIRRNPHVAAPSPTVDLMGPRDCYPAGRVITHCFYDQPTPPEGQPGRFSAICGAMIYRDQLLGPRFAGNLFVSDPVYNIVHRMIVKPQGATFHGERAPDEQRSEFLASADPWFRPASIRTGPDGALWVCDMHRVVIEHPEWIDERLIDKLDLRKGHDRGRIYRIYPVDAAPRKIPRLDRLDTAGLVAALEVPNGWQRDMAQQMLLWRADEAAVAPLAKMAAGGKTALARLHALCTLDGLGALPKDVVLRAVADEHPGVRRHAVRLSESFLTSDAAVGEALLKLLDDPDPQVRMQLAYSLGEWDDPRAGRALGKLAARSAGDPYLTAAVMSSATRNLDQVVAEILPDAAAVPARAELIGKLLRLAAGLGDRETVAKVFGVVAAKPQAAFENWQYRLMAQVLDGLARQQTSLPKLLAGDDAATVRAAQRVAELFDAARRVAKEDHAASADRVAAMQILGRGPDRQQDDLELLAGLLVPQSSIELQRAAVDALGRLGHGKIPELLLAGWAEQGPKVHDAVFEVLLRREAWVAALLDQMPSRPELAAALGSARRDLLLRHRSEEIRRRAEKLLGGPTTKEEIQQALEKFQPVLKIKGDLAGGKKMFTEATCADCHKLEDVGKHVGPDLRTLVDKSPQALLVATIDPNRALEDRFIEYTAVTTDGLQLSGMLLEETGNSITLVDAKGQPHVILRKDVEELVSNRRSHMPEGLQGKLSLQQMADLLAFVAHTGPPCKEFPGNRPGIVRPGDDGSLELTASRAAIYGPTIVFETKYGNLGYFSSEEDYAVWTLEISRGGRFDVWFDWACQSGEAEKPFRLQVDGQAIRGKVPSSGTWDRYLRQKFGQVKLEAGEHRLSIRSDGPISGPLIDLRSVNLVPEPEPTRARRP